MAFRELTPTYSCHPVPTPEGHPANTLPLLGCAAGFHDFVDGAEAAQFYCTGCTKEEEEKFYCTPGCILYRIDPVIQYPKY